MCEYTGRLVAWMDREVEAAEAAEIERHVRACTECRNCLAEFERVSGVFEQYCKAVVRSEENRRAIRVEPILWAAAAAIVLGVMLMYPKRSVTPPAQHPSVTAAARTDSSPSVAVKATDLPSPLKPDRHAARRKMQVRADRDVVSPRPCSNQGCTPTTARMQNANWVADEPAIQIAIPAAAMFPPGAVPDGISFVADLRIGADGSVQQVRLQPQISEFERRSSQP